MPRYKIVHRTYYNYSAIVTLGEHHLRLRPREDHGLRIESFVLTCSPVASISWYKDVEDNSIATARFTQPTQQLLIESEVIIEQYDASPLDFIVADHAITYPFAYRTDDRAILDPYMVLPDQETKQVLDIWLQQVWHAGEILQTYTLLLRLVAHIHDSFIYKEREEPGVQTPRQTLAKGSGSCRDFALFFMEALRCLGLASRFVSGYLHAPLMSHLIGSTHAWAEVYLPGVGWKGFDPTIGDIVGQDHIAVAVSRLPESVPPVSGSFAGVSESTLEVGVWVSLY